MVATLQPLSEAKEHPVHILLVETDHSVRQALVMLLRAQGYRVTPAATVTQAHHELAAETPNLLLSGVEFPDGDGAQVLEQYRAHTLAPAIALTQEGGTPPAGFDCGFAKPLQFGELLACVRRWDGSGSAGI